MRDRLDMRFRVRLPKTPFAEFEELGARHEELKGDLAAAKTRLGELERSLSQAKDDLLSARADAVRTGGKEPSDAPVRRVEEEIERASQRVPVLELAIDRTVDELCALVQSHPEWFKELDRQVEAARAALRDEIGHYAEAREAYWHLASLRGWLRTFPDRPEQPLPKGAGPVFTDRRRGAQVGHDQLIQALREDVDPPGKLVNPASVKREALLPHAVDAASSEAR